MAFLLVPKLPLGNGFLKFQLPEEPSTNKLELARHGFPSRSLGTSIICINVKQK